MSDSSRSERLADRTLVPGYRLDRYELIWPLAEGGMASVWIARLSRKHGFEKIVAIKTILPKLAADDRFQKMFLDEARIASRIHHTNVAEILDLGEENDIFYLVMEWVDGDSISRLLRTVAKKGQRFPVGIAVRILADVCDGLHAAHELRGEDGAPLGVVHRDVSPQNVLVTVNGVAKLIDFGIAKAKNRLAAETNAGFLKGKVHYMAPEQALGKAVDRRADIWAVGTILYHLLAGYPPYEGENELETLHKLGSGVPPPPLPAHVPPPVADVIMQALAHAPDARWATASELRAALERALHASGLAASTSDVAAFHAEHLAEHVATRRRAIEAASRPSAGKMLPTPNDPKGFSVSSTEIMVVGTTPAGVPPIGTTPAREVAIIEVDVGSAGGGSLGLGSVASSVAAPPKRSNRGVIAVIAVLGLLGAAGAVLIVLAVGSGRAGRVAAGGGAGSARSIGSDEGSSVGATATATGAASVTAQASASASAKPASAADTSRAGHAGAPAATGGVRVTAVTTMKTPPQPPPTATATASASTSAKKKRIDDGF